MFQWFFRVLMRLLNAATVVCTFSGGIIFWTIVATKQNSGMDAILMPTLITAAGYAVIMVSNYILFGRLMLWHQGISEREY